MKMSEYLQKKNEIEDKQKTSQDRIKELEDAERRAREIREALKAEKKKEISKKISNFSILGMRFRPWSLNDMIILLVIAVIVVGGLSFVPEKNVSSDTGSDAGFFTKLFGGFTVKDVDSSNTNNEDISNNEEDVVGDADSGDSSSDTSNDNTPEVDDSKRIDFGMGISYQGSKFTTLNASNVDDIWYTLKLDNTNSFPIKCNVNHYVNDNLKSDKSTVSLEAGKPREINIRELASDTVDTLSRVKIEVSCSDGLDSSTENTKVERLKFYFG